MSQLTPPYPLILDGLKQGRVIPFLGAGASLGSRASDAEWEKYLVSCVPTANELAKYLAKQAVFPSDESPDLTKVAQYFGVVGGRGALEQELHSIFDCDFPLTSLHTFLAEIPSPLLIVTTNYDDLIERAFKAKGRSYDVVIHTTNPKFGDRVLWWQHDATEPQVVIPQKLDIDLSRTTVIYKMHGAVDRFDRGRDQYVITEDDYVDFLARMIKNKAIPSIFAEPFQTKHFLFLGYGLRDWNWRVVLNRIEKDLRRHKKLNSWAIQKEPSSLEKKLWERREVNVYDMTIDDFVKELQSRQT